MVNKPAVTCDTPSAVAGVLSKRLRARRVACGLTQAGVAELAGVSRDTVRGFEASGRITLHHLLRVAGAVGALAEFGALLADEEPQSLAELEDRAANRGRVRGRRRIVAQLPAGQSGGAPHQLVVRISASVPNIANSLRPRADEPG